MKIIDLKNISFLIKKNFLYLKDIYFAKLKINLNFLIINKKIYINYNLNLNNLKKINTFISILKNILIGIKKLWEIEMEISGLGYKISIEKNILIFNLGYSSLYYLKIPYYINIKILKNKLFLSSVYKDLLGNFSYIIFKIKKYNPYKKKGILLKKHIFFKKSNKKKQ